MADYLVTWQIDIEADSPEEAAEIALRIQRDAGSDATCFEVSDKDSLINTVVDLAQEEIENVPCVKCGSTENLLHVNGECTECFNPDEHPDE